VTDDRELLKLAAKAAGYEIESFSATGDAWIYSGAEKNADDERPITLWNALDDDGDALRLAVKLDMRLALNKALNQSFVWPNTFKEVATNWEDHGGDKLAATRRAIVEAAAEIGKQMP
jgi:hypothetical protein